MAGGLAGIVPVDCGHLQHVGPAEINAIVLQSRPYTALPKARQTRLYTAQSIPTHLAVAYSGKILELVIARRLSFWAETRGLLPTKQFGTRPRRSCEQALVVLVEEIKEAWRENEILSLVSFDLNGAYNGMV